MILGGGPNRIGQGIEFDYCCVHAAFALRDAGFETIMVNCNPETVSTDYDTSDKLYFEPLTVEDVLAIYEKEKPEGVDRAVRRADAAEHRRASWRTPASGSSAPLRTRSTWPRTATASARSWRELGHPAARVGHGGEPRRRPSRWRRAIGYPLMVRPSYVLGGRGMEVVHDEEMLRQYVAAAVDVDAGAADPDRQVPRERHRGRGRRHRRRHRRLRPRGHGAHRAGGHPLRRLGLRHPARSASRRSTWRRSATTRARSPSS